MSIVTDRKNWIRIRREMFHQIQAEVQARVGTETGEIRNYRLSYERDLKAPWKPARRDDLLTSLRKARLILLADFHALQQSQKSHLRLLKSLDDDPAEKILAVECVDRRFQSVLDRFAAGKMTEREFLKRVGWRENWGFPWDHYKPLFQWAQKNKVAMIALNDGAGKAKLKARDRFAARRLTELASERPAARVIAVYGDLHCATDRLPKEIKTKSGGRLEPLVVVQNPEPVYFRLLERGLDHSVEVVRWSANRWGLVSVPPWVKWQNYLLYLEHAVDAELDSDDAEEIDPTDQVARYVRWLGKELDLPFKESELSVYTAGDPDLWEKIRRTASSRERAWLELMIEDGRSFYLSSAGWGYLARPSVNHAATLAMQYIHDRLCGGTRIAFEMPDDFLRMIWIEGMSYFGSKIINHKRKTDTLADIRASLSSRQAEDKGREALRLALSQKMHEMMAISGAPSSSVSRSTASPKKKSSYIAAAHLLGGLMGERLYNGVRRGLLSRATLRALLAKEVGHPRFPLMYYEALEIIESLPVPFKSKREKL